MARKKKEPDIPTPPAPFITPPVWLEDSVGFANKISEELGLIAWARDQHNAGTMPDHTFDEEIHTHLDNIRYINTDLILSLDRAMDGANKQEDAVSMAVEELKTMWWRLKRVSA